MTHVSFFRFLPRAAVILFHFLPDSVQALAMSEARILFPEFEGNLFPAKKGRCRLRMRSAFRQRFSGLFLLLSV